MNYFSRMTFVRLLQMYDFNSIAYTHQSCLLLFSLYGLLFVVMQIVLIQTLMARLKCKLDRRE